MPLDFPASPTSGDQTTLANVTYQFDGSKWITLSSLFDRGKFPAGTVSDPGFSVSGDTNTGLYAPAADQIAITTGGVERVEFGTTEVVFNDGGGDYDFRVEGDTVTNLLFVDASADSVAFNSDVTITKSAVELAKFNTTETVFNDGGADLDFRVEGDTVTNLLLVDAGNDSVAINSDLTITKSAIELAKFNTTETVFNDGGADQDFRVEGDTEVNLLFVDASTDRVGIGTNLPAQALHVVGQIVATDDITAFYSSDRRLKQDIEPIEDAVEKIKQINGVTYAWNDEYLKDKYIDGYFVRDREAGVIAQEIEEVLPEVVATRENGYKAVKYDRLVALLIQAVKEQQEQIDELKAKLEE